MYFSKRAGLLLNGLVLICATVALSMGADAQPNSLRHDTGQPIEEQVDSGRPAGSVHVLTREDADAWLDGFMPYALSSGDFAGAVVVIVKDGALLTSRGFGYSNLETGQAMNPEKTLVRPGSISKLFTWTAVMQLVEAGQIDLDADVNTYLDFAIPEKFGAPITMRNLMTHTAGFEQVLKGLIAKDAKSLPDLEQYIKSSLPDRVYPPGAIPAYSNYGTALAGYVVERVSGEPFETYIERHVFQPLGMTKSSFRQPLPQSLSAAMSHGYVRASDAAPKYFELIPAAPAGALSATANDMAKFMIAQLDGTALMSIGTSTRMQTSFSPHVPPLNAMALGFYQQNRNGVEIIGHGGDTAFFHSNLALMPQQDVGLFVSLNSTGADATQSLLVREELLSKFTARYISDPEAFSKTSLESAKEHSTRLAGTYDMSRTSVTNFMALTRYLGQANLAVDQDTGDLIAPFFGKAENWREVEPYVWRRLAGSERLAVSFNEDGSVRMWSFEPVSPFMVYFPAPWYRSSALLTPMLIAALVALISTLICWPVSALVRRHYRRNLPFTGRRAQSYKLVRYGLLLVMLYLLGWAVMYAGLLSDISNFNEKFDLPIRILQIAQIVVYMAFCVAIIHAFNVLSARESGLFAKIWSLVMPISIAIVIWFAAVAGWLGFDLAY